MGFWRWAQGRPPGSGGEIGLACSGLVWAGGHEEAAQPSPPLPLLSLKMDNLCHVPTHLHTINSGMKENCTKSFKSPPTPSDTPFDA